MYLTTEKEESVKNLRILIVEDEGIIAADMKDCLETLGYFVIETIDTGEKAIEKAEETRPDLILMDIRLKGEMDGIQAAQQIWESLRIPIIYTTGHSDKTTLDRAKFTAPFGYLIKPFEERELYVAIETAFRRYQLEKQLKQREEWLDTIFRSIGDGIIVFDIQSSIMFMNPRAEMMTGWTQDEAVDKDLTEIFNSVNETTRSPIENPVKNVMETGIPFYVECNTILISKNGSEIPIDDSAAALKDSNGEIIGGVLVFRDITDRRQAEERKLALERAKLLEQQMTELQKLNQLKDEFLSTVSHELRAPLANIKMAIHMLETVLDERGRLSADENSQASPTIRYFQILRDQCEQELKLVNDLLDLQRINADAYTLTLTEIYLQELIPQVTEAFEILTRNRQQNLQVSVPASLPPLMSDWQSLVRIVRELLHNACKYTPPGEHITMTVQALPPEQNGAKITKLQLKITNSGVEIPTEELPRVFDQFYRLPVKDYWRQGGTGLGLALVHKLVNYLGGSIQVESANSQVCFIVELPVMGNG